MSRGISPDSDEFDCEDDAEDDDESSVSSNGVAVVAVVVVFCVVVETGNLVLVGSELVVVDSIIGLKSSEDGCVDGGLAHSGCKMLK